MIWWIKWTNCKHRFKGFLSAESNTMSSLTCSKMPTGLILENKSCSSHPVSQRVTKILFYSGELYKNKPKSIWENLSMTKIE